jgi:hypothetical protein
VLEAMQSDAELRLVDIMAWFKENMIVSPSMQDLKIILQLMLNERKIVEKDRDYFQFV